MSTPNPAEIIAEVLYSQESSGDFIKYGQGGYPYTDCDALATYVMTRLAQSGHTIFETERYERLQRGANELGRCLDRQLQDILTLTGAHNLIGEDGDGDWMGVWERLGELVEKGHQHEAARRIGAATTTEEVRAVIAEFLPAATDEGEKS